MCFEKLVYDPVLFYVQVTVHRDNLRINNQQDASRIQNFFYFVTKLYMFRACTVPIIRSSTSRELSSLLNETLKVYGLERGLRPLVVVVVVFFVVDFVVVGLVVVLLLLLLSVGTSNVQIVGKGQASF